MTWTITTTTTISASRAVTLAERIPSEPIKFVVLHPGTGAGGTVTIWDDLGRSVASTRIDSLSPRHEAEFFSDRSIFNVSAAIDGNATLSGAGVSVYLVSREAPEPSIADGSTSFAGPVVAPNSISSFLPGQTAGVPDTASLAVNAGASQRVVLPAGDAFRFDFSGFGPFALRFGTSSVAAVATDFPGIVGLPIYYRKPEGATHVAVYGIGAGSVVVSGGTTP